MTFLPLKRTLSNTAIIPVVVTVLCLVLFADKAFHIDDTLFIWSAKQIRSNPADFYGFVVNWDGTERPIAEVTKNPPGCCYYIALVSLLFGWGEVALHLAFLVPAVAAAFGTYYLAKEFCSWPVVAALAAVLTPAFLVSSTNIMCDTMMLALWVWAVVFWVWGMKKDKQLNLLFGSVLIAACALTKYFGISLLGLLFVYSLVQGRKFGVWALFLLIPVAILAGYHWITYALYGRGLLLDAASYAAGHRQGVGVKFYSNLLMGLAFTGGCVVTGLFYIWLLSRRAIVFEILLVILLVASLYDDGRVGIGFLIQLSLMVLGGVSILWLAGADFWRHRDADSLLLLLWVGGTFVFAGFINWTVNARSILPMIPAVGILLMRRVENHSKAGQQGIGWRLAWPLIPSAIVALLVCTADYTWANTAREAAAKIHDRFESERENVLFQGHWGFQYYMEANGYRALDFVNSNLMRGDIVIVPENQSYLRPLPKGSVRAEGYFQFKQYRWLAMMNPSLRAGFYSGTWGQLPFAVGSVAPEKYYVFVAN